MSLPDYLVQEIRATVAVVCREMVMTKKADGASSAKQEETMMKAFHGSAGYASVLTQLIDGKQPFDSLFDRQEIENNREGNEFRSGSGAMLELKELFHRKSDERFIVHERGFTRDVIALSKGKQWSGRNINDKALDAIANYRHALRIYNEEYKQDSATGNPSGKKIEDMTDYILRRMFVFLQGKKSGKGTTALDTEGRFTMENLPPKYVFTGYFVFVLFGPQPTSGKTLSCLTADGTTNMMKSGRAAARKEAAEVKKAEREEGTDDGIYRRGVALKDKASAAHLANAEYQHQLKHLREMLVIYNGEHSLLLKELSEAMQLSKQARGDDDMEQESAQWLSEVRYRITELKEKKRKLLEEEEQIRSRGPKKQVLAYYETVGSFAAIGSSSGRSSSTGTPTASITLNQEDSASCLTDQSPK
jgi:hypothetical protein